MSNNAEKIPIKIGPREYDLIYDMRAFTVAQTRHNIRITASMLTDPSIADMPVLIWVGLINERARMNVGGVARMCEEARWSWGETRAAVLTALATGIGADESDEFEQGELEMQTVEYDPEETDPNV